MTGDMEALRVALESANAALTDDDDANGGGHAALALLVETVERIHPSMRSRDQRLRTLIDYYDTARRIGHTSDGQAGGAFALVSREGTDGEALITTHATFETACSYAGDHVLEGVKPIALFGLDTGEMVVLAVHVPVVYLSPHRYTMDNPLAASLATHAA
jgi:hypothetical protein